jgi:hypothetical protein
MHLGKTSKSSALSLQQLHWVQYLGLTHHKDFELILNPLGTSTVEEIYPSLFCSLDMMDDVWVISGSLPAEHVDVYSKYPVVVRDVHSLDIVGYIAFQRCFASSIVTSKVKGKFLVTAWDRYVYSTHIANNLCYREDLHGIFITDVKKKLLYTHPTPISNFSVSDGAYFVINDERCVYLAALQEHILEFKSKSKLSELRKYDPISSDELGMSSFDPALGVLWCCTKSGKIFIWYEVSDPLKFEVIDLHWNLAREHPTLIKCDAVYENGYIFVVSNNDGQYVLLGWNENEKKFVLREEGRFDWYQPGCKAVMEISCGRLFILNDYQSKSRIKNLANLQSPEIVWRFPNAFSYGGARIMSSPNKQKVFFWSDNGDLVVWDLEKILEKRIHELTLLHQRN